LDAASGRSFAERSRQCGRDFDDVAFYSGQHRCSAELGSFQLEQHDHLDYQHAVGSGRQLAEWQHGGWTGYV
jgi:hypothetical protein